MNSWRQCVPWGLVEIKVLEIGSCQSMWGGRGRERQHKGEMQEEKIMRPRVQEG